MKDFYDIRQADGRNEYEIDKLKDELEKVKAERDRFAKALIIRDYGCLVTTWYWSSKLNRYVNHIASPYTDHKLVEDHWKILLAASELMTDDVGQKDGITLGHNILHDAYKYVGYYDCVNEVLVKAGLRPLGENKD